MLHPQLVQIPHQGQVPQVSYPFGTKAQYPSIIPQQIVYMPQQMPSSGPAQTAPQGPAVQHPVQQFSQSSAASASPKPVSPVQPIQIKLPSPSSERTSSPDAAQPQTPSTAASIPVYPQSFHQPIQLVQPIMMQYGHTPVQPQFFPMVQIPTPNGPQFIQQPVYYLSESTLASHQKQTPSVSSASQEPVLASDISSKKMSRSASYDGSEISDSGDPKYFHSASLKRYPSVDSRDGYGSDYFDAHSRIGSESFDSYEPAEESPKPDMELSKQQPMSPDTALLIPFDGLCISPQQFTAQQPVQLSPERRQKQHSVHYVNRKGGEVFRPPSERMSNKKRPTSKERQEELYKTELCNYWINGNKCRFGKRCIFAHGQHELRLPKRKMDRNRLRPPLRKQITNICNKLSEANFDACCTEFLCAVVEEIRDDEASCLEIVKQLFNKVLTSAPFRALGGEMWRKMINVHPMAQTMSAQMFDLCIAEFNNPSSAQKGIFTMQWMADLCIRKCVMAEEKVAKLLDEMHGDSISEQKVELWCNLIESLKDHFDTNKYFARLASFKTKFGASVRYMIMDLEELKALNWVVKRA